jgi:hypothetical protein
MLTVVFYFGMDKVDVRDVLTKRKCNPWGEDSN